MKRRRRLIIGIPVAVLAAVALFALVGVLGSRHGSSGSPSSSSVASMAAPAPTPDALKAAGGSSSADSSSGSAAQLGSGNVAADLPPATASGPHYLQRDGQLSLIVAHGAVLATAQRIAALTQGMGGFVLSSSVGNDGGVVSPVTGSGGAPEPMPLQQSTPDSGLAAPTAPSGGQLTASIQVRVPVNSFDVALRRFSQLGTVDTVSTSSQDVTSQYVDLQARLNHYRAVEARLVRFLAQTHTVGEMLAVQDRLDRVQLTIEELTAELKSMQQTTSYGTISVFMWEKGVHHAVVGTTSSFTGTFWHSLVVLGRGARLCALAVAAALPFLVVFGLIAAAGWYAWRTYRRRHHPLPPATTA
jgi:hypothetical protein